MSRFRNLEFPENAGKQERSTPVLKDEQHYLATADLAFEQGRFDEALRAYAKVIEFNPASAAAWTGQVRMLIELGECQEAKLWADKALESFPNEPELLAAKAVALARSGDTRAALVFSDASIEERGNTPYVWLARGDVLLARRESRAGFCFDKALALASFHWVYFWLASRVHTFHRMFAKALRYAQRALETASDRAVVWAQLGQCQLAVGLASAAQASLEQARQLDPDSVGAGLLRRAGETGLRSRLGGLWRRWFGG